MDRADARGEFHVRPSPCRRRPLEPRIIVAGGDTQHPALGGKRVNGPIRAHELERRDGTVLVSVANQAAAFVKISRSSAAFATSVSTFLSRVRCMQCKRTTFSVITSMIVTLVI
jgi:hypothetical protein